MNSHRGTLALGTAQLAEPYGSVRKVQPLSESESITLVREAIRLGVDTIDTARAYGASESRIGNALEGEWARRAKVITKLSPLAELARDATEDAVRIAVDASITKSCEALGMSSLPVVLLHRTSHLHAWQGALWSRLVELRDAGAIGELGVSVQDTEEAIQALKEPHVTHIQMPFNLLDFRWRQAEFYASLRKRPEIAVHARSALLQGILVASETAAWPRISGLDVAAVMRWLETITCRFERRNIADLCYAYVRAQPWVSTVVVGMESLGQLKENISLFAANSLSLAECTYLEGTRPPIPASLLSPTKWPRVP